MLLQLLIIAIQYEVFMVYWAQHFVTNILSLVTKTSVSSWCL